MKTSSKGHKPHHPVRPADSQAEQLAAAQTLAAAMPFNAGKAQEFGRHNAVAPPRGASASSSLPTAFASTLSERNASPKAGALDRTRSAASGQVMTTNQGVAVGDNQNSLKAGLRGQARRPWATHCVRSAYWQMP